MKKPGRDRRKTGRRSDERTGRREGGRGRIKADNFRESDDERNSGKSERSGYKKFDRQDKPFKAGTRPAGRRSRDEDDRGEREKRNRSFRKEDRPYKEGTKPAGRREREEGEKRPRTTSDSQREWIRKDRTFDREDKPFKDRSSERFESDKGNYRDRRKSFDRDKPFRKTSRENNYGEKKRYGNKERSYDKFSPKKDDGKIRLNKYIANSGICSRREADEYIAAGVVSVNGKTITEMGYKVSPGDEVKFHDKPLRSEKLVYVLLNKPKDFITTTEDDRNRKTVMNLIKDAGRERLYPVGRLDRSTTGVLLLTNDGELTKKLTHPSHEIKKIYQVELDKPLKPSDLDEIKNGIELEDGIAEVDEIIYSGDSKKVLGIELHSGRNRIVRRIFEALDYRVVKLDRVYFAGLTKKDLSRGRWRFLTEMEVNMLKMLTAKKPKRMTEKFE